MTKSLNEQAWKEYEEIAKKAQTGEEDKLKELGINVRDEDGKLKTMMEVMEEIGGLMNDEITL